MAELIDGIVSVISPLFSGMDYLCGQLINNTPVVGDVRLGVWFLLFFGIGSFISSLR